MEAQRSLDWFRKRLGKFTGSKIGDLMKSGRNKDQLFGDTAYSYIYQVAAERNMNPLTISDDDLFEEYLSQVDISTKAMRWGVEKESEARDIYEIKTSNRIVETGLCIHKSIKDFASSPDGYYCSDDGEKGCIEIKCVSQSVFIKYKTLVSDNNSLYSTEPKYFYQCQSHMMCTDAQWCDFIIYNPFQKKSMYVVRIYPDQNVFDQIENRINAANKIIEEILKSDDI